MNTLIVGASGATGKKLVEQLLKMGESVKIIARPSAAIPENWNQKNKVTVIKAEISKMSVEDMAGCLNDCQCIASCLGHNITLKGIYGKPRALVTDSVVLICEAIRHNAANSKVKFVLMNTTGNRNKDLDERISLGERIAMSLIRRLLPPQLDNEMAADYLRLNIGQKSKDIEWVVVRPDSLIEQDIVTDYETFHSPRRSPLFNPGKTSRINTAHFMATLLTDNSLWERWMGRMPVIYNKES